MGGRGGGGGGEEGEACNLKIIKNPQSANTNARTHARTHAYTKKEKEEYGGDKHND